MKAKSFSLRMDSAPDEAWGEDAPTVRLGKLHIASTSEPIITKIPKNPAAIDGHEAPDTGIGIGEAVACPEGL